MELGFIKVAAITPNVKVADPIYNSLRICEKIDEAMKEGAMVLVFPELCITGYTCQDLFLQEVLLKEAKVQLMKIAAHTEGKNGIVFVGLPFSYGGNLYNVAAGISGGRVLCLVPKVHIPNYNEFYEARYFTSGMKEPVLVELEKPDDHQMVPMGTNLLVSAESMPELKIAAELCEDLWVPNPPSISHALAGADLIVNLSASDEVTGKDRYRRDLVAGQSARLLCGYIYASAGDGESTQDVVYSGHNLIAENGTILAQSKRFCNETIYSEIDVMRLQIERRRMTTYRENQNYISIPFSLKPVKTTLTRFVNPAPFVPGEQAEREKRCEEILSIQAMGLKKRLEHTGCRCAVVGISGGLDSTLALLVTVKAFALLALDPKGIQAVTMPGFGTTDRTYDNAVSLVDRLGATLRKVDIKQAVQIHFRDIGHDETVHDVTYENGQARERTQILMDIANQENALVVGTGDLSELALGWATYNGDHMSMYGVNASIPKTLVRHLVRYYADTCQDEPKHQGEATKTQDEPGKHQGEVAKDQAQTLRDVLLDILDTPVSPELLPPKEGKISQKTEDIVGPYELHDFYLYYVMRFGFSPKKIYALACHAFAETYEKKIIVKWLTVFVKRFFSQQFKRSCLPDGPKVGTVAVSPRGDLRMPSDASPRIWLAELLNLSDHR
ncbi:NAD(+) synthase [Lachnospiraceae bacterium ZAX-1]